MKTISNEEAIDLLSRTVDRFGGEFTYSGNAIMTQNQSLSSASKAKWQQLCRVETLRDAKAVVAAVQTRSVTKMKTSKEKIKNAELTASQVIAPIEDYGTLTRKTARQALQGDTLTLYIWFETRDAMIEADTPREGVELTRERLRDAVRDLETVIEALPKYQDAEPSGALAAMVEQYKSDCRS